MQIWGVGTWHRLPVPFPFLLLPLFLLQLTAVLLLDGPVQPPPHQAPLHDQLVVVEEPGVVHPAAGGVGGGVVGSPRDPYDGVEGGRLPGASLLHEGEDNEEGWALEGLIFILKVVVIF